MRNVPLISVVLPVYNAEKYLGVAIDSILKQTHTDFELIIVDDCSKDSSWNIIQHYAKKDKRIICGRNKRNVNGCENLNTCVGMARGKYIARADNDDWSYPDRLAKQISFMESHPKVGILGGVMELIDENGNVIGSRKYKFTDQEIRKKIFRYSPFSHPLVMIRKSVLDEVGKYNCVFAPADDYDLYFRIGKKAEFANLPDVLLQYRIVSGSMTHILTRKMELATIRVRNKYRNDKDYNMTIMDTLYMLLQYFSIFIIPSSIKLRLFNLMRNTA